MTNNEKPTSPRTGHYAFGLRDGGSEWHVGPIGACCGKRMLPTDPPLPESALSFDPAKWREAAAATPSLNAERLADALSREWPFAYSPPEAWVPVVERALARLDEGSATPEQRR